MIFFRTSLFFTLIWCSLTALGQESTTQWASELIGFSSEFAFNKYPKQYRAKLAVGSPNVVTHKFVNSREAWTPKTKDNPNKEWIHLGYASPISAVQQIVVAQLGMTDVISNIWLYDTEGKEHLVYTKTVKPDSGLGSQLFHYPIDPTSYAVQQVKIELTTEWLSGYSQIGGIAICNHQEKVEVKINTVASLPAASPTPTPIQSINSEADELLPVIAPDGKRLYFVRQNHPENIGRKSQDIWYADIDTNDNIGTPINVGEPLNNEGSSAMLSITPDNQKALLLNVYKPNGRMGNGISIAEKNGTNWNMPQEVTIEDFENQSNYGEYFLTSDGKTMLSCVMRADRIGAKDIYVSFWQEEKKNWSIPKNLGATINTTFTEVAPFLAADGKTLYFSSSGHPGYGNNDIFVSTRLDDSWTNWTVPQNMGLGINSSKYDAYYTLPASGKFAYFIRYGENTGADIYRLPLTAAQKPKPVLLLSGRVIDAITKEPLGADILYESLSRKEELGVANSDKKTGRYQIVLPSGDNYGFLAEAEGYIAINQNLDLTNLEDYEEKQMDIELYPIKNGQTIRLNNVFFETSKYELKPAAALELNRLVQLLNKYPQMVIEIGGHTDSKGSDNYNYTLSKNRAKAVYDYLLTQAIPQKRLEYKGYGEKSPIATNKTEKGRKENRRVEFKINRVN